MTKVLSPPSVTSCNDNEKTTEGGERPRHTQTHVTFSRPCLIQVAHENCAIAKQGYYVNGKKCEVEVKEALSLAMQSSKAYHYAKPISPLSKEGGLYYRTKFHIYKGSSIEAASLLVQNGGHIGVLNSASGKTPGGKWFKGTLSQEDVICRASLLFPCLEQFLTDSNSMYGVNVSNDEFLYSSSSCCIYSPYVPIIRQDDNVKPRLLDKFFLADILSMPAPNAFVLARKKNGMLEEEMIFRLRRALTLFANHGCTDLVLCAFGCGIHGNNPQMVASFWEQLFSSSEFEGKFQTVVFAINPLRPGNYTAFKQVLHGAECS